MRAGIYTFRIPDDFWRICIRIEFESLFQENVHVCVFVSVMKEIPVKGARHVYLIQIWWCSELFTYVYVYWIPNSGLKQNNAHVYFPVGMVIA